MGSSTISVSSNGLFSVSGGPMEFHSSMQRVARSSRCKPSLKVLRAVQVSGAESQAAPAIKAGGHMKKTRTLYEVLGLNRGASAQDIKTAYRKLARQFHPDAAVSSEEKSISTQIFLQIQNAYAVLSKPEDRAQYDRQLVMPQAQRQRWSRASSGGAYQNPFGHVVRNWETDQCW